jgi:CheY-like chemotaxis protein/c-di-GMP-binding flagellar brake protein YcgR
VGAQLSILIVEDDPNLSRILKTHLRRSGFAVETVSTAASGLQSLLIRNYDLILLDVRLPDADGLEALPRLRAASGYAPFLLVTAYEEESLRSRAIMAGAVDIVFKPFDLEALEATIRHHVGARARISAVHVDQIISLRIGAGDAIHEVAARVVEKSGDTFAIVVDPRHGPAEGEPVVVQMAGEDGLYAFRSRVLASSQTGSAILAQPATIRRSQRRRHPRVAVHVPVLLRVEHLGEAISQEVLPLEEAIQTTSRDISMGGMSLVTPIPVDTGARVRLDFDLPHTDVEARSLRVRAEVIRLAEMDSEPATGIWRIAVRFLHLSAVERERLRAFISGAPQN